MSDQESIFDVPLARLKTWSRGERPRSDKLNESIREINTTLATTDGAPRNFQIRRQPASGAVGSSATRVVRIYKAIENMGDITDDPQEERLLEIFEAGDEPEPFLACRPFPWPTDPPQSPEQYTIIRVLPWFHMPVSAFKTDLGSQIFGNNLEAEPIFPIVKVANDTTRIWIGIGEFYVDAPSIGDLC